MCSLVKECPWAEHLTSLQKRGVGIFLMFPHLTMKECPCHVYNDSMPPKQIIRQIITCNQGLQSLVLTSHNTLNSTISP